MGKAILSVDRAFVPEFEAMKGKLEAQLRFLGQAPSSFLPVVDFTVESDLIPEFPNQSELPIVMPVFYQFINEAGYRTIEMYRIMFSWRDDSGEWESRDIYVNKEVQARIDADKVVR